MNKKMAFMTILAAGAAAGLQAQDGFRVGVGFGSMKTTGTPTSLGTNQATSGSNQVIKTYAYDQPTQTPLSLDLAFVEGDDEFFLSYMDSSKKSDKELHDSAHPFVVGGMLSSLGTDVFGHQELKVSTIDLGWKRTFVKGNAGSLAFTTGIRSFSVSDEFTTGGFTGGALNVDIHGKGKGKGTGFGLLAGLHGRYTFNDRFWLTSGVTLAQLDTTVKTDAYQIGSPSSTITFNNDDRHESTLQTESYLRLNVNFVKTFNGFIGYEVKNFGSETAKITNVYTDLGLPTTHGFGLAGFTMGLSYTF
jgi:hypothetical protein